MTPVIRDNAATGTAQTPNLVTVLSKPRVATLAILVMLMLVATIELTTGRQPMCTCGFISLWHGPVDSQNSQQISDWYTFTHVLHGIGFYALLFLVGRRLPVPVRLLIAVFLEGAWEIAENSPFIIDRYRTATFSLDYYGDSIVNSVSDVVAMMVGFWMARRFPVWVTAVCVVAVETVLALVIRDNLTLNIIMLIHPVDAIKHWQLGG